VQITLLDGSCIDARVKEIGDQMIRVVDIDQELLTPKNREILIPKSCVLYYILREGCAP
jgi:hypothetical protein